MERTHASARTARALDRLGIFTSPIRSRKLRFSAALSMPVQVQASVRLSECGSPVSPKVTLNGAVVLEGLEAMLKFGRGLSRARVGADLTNENAMLIPAGEWFVIADSCARAPVTEETPIRLRFHDGDGTPLSETYDLGPLGGEARGLGLPFRVPVAVTVEISTDDFHFGPGPRSTIGGTLVFLRGILARYVFPNGPTNRNGDRNLAGTVEAVAIPVGQTIRFPDQ